MRLMPQKMEAREMLEISHLHKSFGDNEVLHDVSIHVPDGEIYGFIGHNGAGKTTTIRCAVGILEFDSGTIMIDGVNIKEDPIGVKTKTAYLPDNPDLYENLTGIQYLNFVADVFGMPKETRTEIMTEIAMELEIYDSGFALHVTDRRVNKGTSLKYLCERNGINMENVMAVGDSQNDEDFLKQAGYRIAVANAEDKLKEISTYTCEKMYGDGVAEAIEKFALQ